MNPPQKKKIGNHYASECMKQQYNRQNPFPASIKDRYHLSKPGSEKNTRHLVLDLGGSGLSYEPGDSIGVFPVHSDELVSRTLNAMKATGNEFVQLKTTGELIKFSDFLTKSANISDISPKLLREVFGRQPEGEKKHLLELLLQEDQRESLKKYLAKHEVWDFLLFNEEVNFTPQELTDLLMPLLPRFYSISSSQNYVGNEVHLTIAPLEYESGGHRRLGVCTHYLCSRVETGDPVVPVFIQSSHAFRLPEDPNIPMIMVGPGTGVAPFRAFMQERVLHQGSKGKHWLFFGERHRAYNFFYEEEWPLFAENGHLRLALAFSRDQDEKVYVQDKIRKHGEELFSWLEAGAYFYVCGDAQNMAKDVEVALHDIVAEYGLRNAAEAKEYVRQMRREKRYLRDVY